ncbi:MULTISPECIES: GvpL/GvpF family gas vesicle protein [unclassified Blastococcus]
MLLVHGVLRAPDAGALARVPGPSARAVAEGRLAAVVSEAPAGDLTEDDAVAHLDLLVALVAEVPVLPLALGTVAPDDDAVRAEVLAPAADDLTARLDAVADLVELRLDLEFDVDATVAAIAHRDPDVLALAERSRARGAGTAERMALGEAVALRVAGEHADLAAAWTAPLTAVAESSTVLHEDEQRHRTAHLVRRDRLPDADAAVADLREAAEGRAAVEYVGPLPVYSFLDQVAAPASPAPASRWGW